MAHTRLGRLSLFRAPVRGRESLDPGAPIRRLGAVDVGFVVSGLEAHVPKALAAAVLGGLLWCIALGVTLFALAIRTRS